MQLPRALWLQKHTGDAKFPYGIDGGPDACRKSEQPLMKIKVWRENGAVACLHQNKSESLRAK
jgi:hypothetical protein